MFGPRIKTIDDGGAGEADIKRRTCFAPFVQRGAAASQNLRHCGVGYGIFLFDQLVKIFKIVASHGRPTNVVGPVKDASKKYQQALSLPAPSESSIHLTLPMATILWHTSK
jgi:hypothetical protein